jgi:hypothetical protein
MQQAVLGTSSCLHLLPDFCLPLLLLLYHCYCFSLIQVHSVHHSTVPSLEPLLSQALQQQLQHAVTPDSNIMSNIPAATPLLLRSRRSTCILHALPAVCSSLQMFSCWAILQLLHLAGLDLVLAAAASLTPAESALASAAAALVTAAGAAWKALRELTDRRRHTLCSTSLQQQQQRLA